MRISSSKGTTTRTRTRRRLSYFVTYSTTVETVQYHTVEKSAPSSSLLPYHSLQVERRIRDLALESDVHQSIERAHQQPRTRRSVFGVRQKSTIYDI
jgi:hypothetical protein